MTLGPGLGDGCMEVDVQFLCKSEKGQGIGRRREGSVNSGAGKDKICLKIS